MAPDDSPPLSPLAFFQDDAPRVDDLRAAVLTGLAQPQKALPPKFFYDEAGTALFEAITRTEEYYLTRTEVTLLEAIMPAVADLVGPRSVVVEPGGAAGAKIRVVLDYLTSPAGYIAIDISRTHLIETALRIAESYPDIAVGAVCADFLDMAGLPRAADDIGRRRLGFFPGSTIGNFAPDQAVTILKWFRAIVGADGALLIGVDVKKDRAVLDAAYNDSAGVTAAFNRNLLHRINRELDADIDADSFDHVAFFNERLGRIEMHLRSRCAQRVTVDGHGFDFAADETIHTENSYKYDPADFAELAAGAGLRVAQDWTDPARRFSIHYLVGADQSV
jgi:dimethylhistidine N-methyltransferase